MNPAIRQTPAALGNYTRGRTQRVDMLIIHVMEGSFESTGAWFASLNARASAHYGVSKNGDLAQYVLDSDVAWHAGNAMYNARSIGIELEGYIADPKAFTQGMMTVLVDLCDKLCGAHGIPRDRTHVIGHDEVPDPRQAGVFGGVNHHKDPGPNFQWQQFIDALASKAV